MVNDWENNKDFEPFSGLERTSRNTHYSTAMIRLSRNAGTESYKSVYENQMVFQANKIINNRIKVKLTLQYSKKNNRDSDVIVLSENVKCVFLLL